MGVIVAALRIGVVVAALVLAFAGLFGGVPVAPPFSAAPDIPSPLLIRMLTFAWMGVPAGLAIAGLWPRLAPGVATLLILLVAGLAIVDPAALDFVFNWMLRAG